MKLKIPDKYSTAAILFLGLAAIFVAIALFISLDDFITAAFVISGTVCAITGIFILMFSGGEPIDPRYLSILQAQESKTLYSIIHHLGMQGNAYFLPPHVTGELRVMQFNPVSTYKGAEGFPTGSFRKTGPRGLVTTPSCDLLIQDLKKRNGLIIPHDKDDLTWLLRETIEDVLKIAPNISARWNGSTFAVTLHKYPCIEGCHLIAQASPQCCIMCPCPVCSLCGVLVAEGLKRVVKFDKCSIEPASTDVTAFFSIVP